MTRTIARSWRVGLFIAASATLACSRRDAPPKVPLAAAAHSDSASSEVTAHALLGPAAKAALDSGNVLFRKKDFDGALAQYRQASLLAPQHSAPLFGVYMVARATNNTIMADSALAGIRRRSGAMTAAPHSLSDTAMKRLRDEMKKKATAS